MRSLPPPDPEFEERLRKALQQPLPRARLTVVRSSAPPPPLKLPRTRPAWLDGVPFAIGAVALLFAGAVAVSIAMGWLAP